MTLEEQKALANAEIREVARWYSAECDRICCEQIKSRGSEYRIDDPRNRPPFKALRKEFVRRMTEISEKYGLLSTEN